MRACLLMKNILITEKHTAKRLVVESGLFLDGAFITNSIDRHSPDQSHVELLITDWHANRGVNSQF